MIRIIVLDIGPLGLVTHPKPKGEASDCKEWVRQAEIAGCHIMVPEIVDYELRRELLRCGKMQGIELLEQFNERYSYIALTTKAMRQAAQFWAQARQEGRPTSDDKALDGDVILAAQVACLGLPLDSIVVATTNPGHISRFVQAMHWQEITIGEE